LLVLGFLTIREEHCAKILFLGLYVVQLAAGRERHVGNEPLVGNELFGLLAGNIYDLKLTQNVCWKNGSSPDHRDLPAYIGCPIT
jgi:hypothetical protein